MLVYTDSGQGKICVRKNFSLWFYSFGAFKILSMRFITVICARKPYRVWFPKALEGNSEWVLIGIPRSR